MSDQTPDDRRPDPDPDDPRGAESGAGEQPGQSDETGRSGPPGGSDLGRQPHKPLGPTPGGGPEQGSGSTGPAGFGGGGQSGGANPFEALLGSLGNPGAAGGMDQADLNAFMEQLQSAFAMLGGPGGMFGGGGQGGDGGVNWDVTKDTARKTTASLGADPSPGMGERQALNDAASIAEVWLDEATEFPRTGGGVVAWSRAEWIEKTMPVWRRLVEPVATHIADAMAGALSFSADDHPEAAQFAGMEQMLRPMLRSSGASMFGLQLGQALGRLATEVVGATDIGLPLSERNAVALLPTNVAAFGEGLDQDATDVTLYLTLREAARTRLFAAAPWLREQILAMVEQYARGIAIDTSALEEAVSQIDPNNLEELSAKLEGGLFEPQKTPEQQAILQRLETRLALVEGWVDDVVGVATQRWMPSAAALAETVRRRRATGGPAEETFATLVGLELRPRRMRDAANLWAAVRESRGAAGRDALWSHPDLVPTAADLDDPLGFTERKPDSEADDDFDAALAELLDSDPGDAQSGNAQGDNAQGDNAQGDNAQGEDAQREDVQHDDSAEDGSAGDDPDKNEPGR